MRLITHDAACPFITTKVGITMASKPANRDDDVMDDDERRQLQHAQDPSVYRFSAIEQSGTFAERKKLREASEKRIAAASNKRIAAAESK